MMRVTRQRQRLPCHGRYSTSNPRVSIYLSCEACRVERLHELRDSSIGRDVPDSTRRVYRACDNVRGINSRPIERG